MNQIIEKFEQKYLANKQSYDAKTSRTDKVSMLIVNKNKSDRPRPPAQVQQPGIPSNQPGKAKLFKAQSARFDSLFAEQGISYKSGGRVDPSMDLMAVFAVVISLAPEGALKLPDEGRSVRETAESKPEGGHHGEVRLRCSGVQRDAA